ncbi:Putative Btz domain-containing protein [Septoria linicola]|uniref:Btz domain-containing protein n=1 Tax=Septoria linicola TaxID=215465 RepID=A0A9Q9EL15_9PEZI|nr:Putative Btz domain-containing protein [Septoria linicola]
MAARRSLKSLVSRRRRGDEEGEDDEGPVMVEDSQSEGSVLSDLEDDEADSSSMAQSSAMDGGPDPAQSEISKAATKKKSRKRPAKKQGKDSAPAVVSTQLQSQPAFRPAPDTEAMLNGLQVDDQAVQKVVDFESAGGGRGGSVYTASAVSAPVIVTTDRKTDSPANRQRKDHEEYRRKRDGDPAFIPNRGNFFMHDTRANHGQGSLPIRGAWAGRGRGRGGSNMGTPFTSANPMIQQEKVAEGHWKHDLHDTINEEPSAAKQSQPFRDQIESARLFPRSGANQNNHNGPHAKLSFSSTTLVGKVQIRVLLPGMTAPITFSEVPWKQYTRLPEHRPPLRRDKPVRISIPEHVQRYIFPSSDRSFIFIPRQMRPNQRGYGNDRYQRSIGGEGYSSRRTSMYGGSMYAGSIAASRRSSFASVARENAFSPVGSYMGMPPNRPVVRLPHGSQSHFSASSTPMGPLSGHHTPTGMHMHTFPPPAQPQFQGTPTTTVHQPRPQKAISVTGIESPAMLSQANGPSEQQPFANQLPAHLHEQQTLPPPYFSPRQHFSHPQQQSGTPLAGIPEQAMHAPAFQPMMPYAPGPYYTQYPPQPQGYYYPPGSNGYNSMPMYMPLPQQTYAMSPPSAPPLPPQQSTPQQPSTQPPVDDPQAAPSGMVAHESNGMVFYLPASEAPSQAQGEAYQPAESFVPSYAMPGLPPPTPAPESTYYYGPQMHMPNFYPPQAQQ